MIKISKKEVKELLNSWGCNQIDEIENKLERELSDEEYKEIILHSMGYADFNEPQTLVEFVDFVNIIDDLSDEEIRCLENN